MSDNENGIFSTRTLMAASAVFMALVGLGAAFYPDEILQHLGYSAEGLGVVLVKVLGGLYLGFAILNWMARHNPIGGIYSRPVAMANFVHFLAVALTFVRHLPDTAFVTEYAVAGGANGVFAAGFGWLMFCGRGDSEGVSCG